MPNKNQKIERLPSYLRKNIPKKNFKSCFKVVFLNSSRKGTGVTFINAMNRKIKIHNNIEIIGNSKFMKLNKCIH